MQLLTQSCQDVMYEQAMPTEFYLSIVFTHGSSGTKAPMSQLQVLPVSPVYPLP